MSYSTLSRPTRTRLPLMLAAVLMLSGAPVLAQDAAAPAAPPAPAATPEAGAPADPKAVVATVGGEPITEADIGYAAEDLGQELQNIPPDQRRAFLVTVLIDMKVMASAAREAGMESSDEYQQRLKYLEDRALRRAYFAEKISTSVTGEALQAAYQDYVKTFVPQDEVRASHILVATEDDAKAIKAELDKGASFEQLAKDKSMDPSGAQKGGDLGYFQRGMMVKPFEDAAFSMQVGQISDPVQSQFGWHIIKLVDKRKSQPPKFSEIGAQLQQQLLFKNFDDTVGALKQNLTIEIPDATLAQEVKQQSEAPASAE
jgi:peptidyl-prolyl cis-trans isomerase C